MLLWQQCSEPRGLGGFDPANRPDAVDRAIERNDLLDAGPLGAGH